MLVIQSTIDHLSSLGLAWLYVAALVSCLARYYVAEKKKTARSIGWRPIPGPRSFPVVKNIPQINLREPLLSVNQIAKSYRDVCRIELPSISIVIVNSQRIYNEVCDNKRFRKEPTGAFLEALNMGMEAILTAWTTSENWGIAHRIMAPHCAKMAIADMFDDMSALTNKLVELWSKSGPYVFNPYNEFSKFTLDNIASCAFDLELDSIQSKEPPAFTSTLTFFLSESGKRALRSPFISKYILYKRDQKYRRAIEDLQAFCRTAIEKRKSNGKIKNDMLNAMLYGPDPMLGKRMTEESCVNNILSVLGAGYDTTASMLSWTMICLLKNPHCLERLQQQIDKRLQGRPIAREDLDQLPYLTACLREALRLYPPAYSHGVKLREEAVGKSVGLGREQYLVKRSDTIRLNLMAVQRDPEVWGEDANAYKPERMMDEHFKTLPRNSFKPFGTGARICIGNHFAMQEAHILIPTLLQKFDFKFIDDRARVHIGETLILQPVDCEIKATRKPE